jgi:hypothetical protein
MEVVKKIELVGSSSGKPSAQVRIIDCGVTAPPAPAAAAFPPAAAGLGSKRPAETSSAKATKKTITDESTAAEGVNNPEKNQKKIQLASGLEYVDIKVCALPSHQLHRVLHPTNLHKVGTGQVASGGKKIVVGYKGVLKVGRCALERGLHFHYVTASAAYFFIFTPIIIYLCK